MGNKASKLSRSTPKLNQTQGRPNLTSTSAPRSPTSRVSFIKSNEIQQDGMDLHLNQMLRKLGQVEVPQLSTNFQPKTDNMIKILEKRGNDSFDILSKDSKTQSNTKGNIEKTQAIRLKLKTIVEILKASKSTERPINLSNTTQTNSIKYDEESQKKLELVDQDTLNYLVEHFNTIDNIKLVKNPDPNQQDKPLKLAFWPRSPETSKSS